MAYNCGPDPAYMRSSGSLPACVSSSIFTPLSLQVSKPLKLVYGIVIICIIGLKVESDAFTGCTGVDMVHARR